MTAFTSAESLADAVERWFDRQVEPLAATEHSRFDAWREEFTGPLVIYGAGGLGRKLAIGLQAEGIPVHAFCDSNSSLWGTELLGLPVLSPAEAAAYAGQTGGFLISTWSLGVEKNNASIYSTLKGLGVVRCEFFTTAFWRYPERFLPHYRIDLPSKLQASRPQVVAASRLFADDESRSQFFTQLRMLATTTYDEASYATPGSTYFPVDLVGLSPEERFVDCGAYTGDTLQSLLRMTHGKLDRYWGFEPDPQNIVKLRTCLQRLDTELADHATLFPFAVGNVNGRLKFEATGGVGARVSETGEVEVECRRLDDLLVDTLPTFLKMDIEGAELDALSGGQELLARCQPICAICVYHTQDHLWNIPLRLAEILPDHGLHFRAHLASYDVVCYAVPRARKIFD